MNDIINRFLLARDKFIPEMHLDNPLRLINQDLLIVFVGHLLKTKKEYKNLEKQDIQNIFAKMN